MTKLIILLCFSFGRVAGQTVNKQDSTAVKINHWPYADVWNVKDVSVIASYQAQIEDCDKVWILSCPQITVFADRMLGTKIILHRRDSLLVKIVYEP